MRNLIFVLICFGLFSEGKAQHSIILKNKEFVLKNDFFERIISFDNQSCYTTSFTNGKSKSNLIRKNSEEFSFLMNGKKISGSILDRMFEYKEHLISEEKNGSKILSINLSGIKGKTAEKIDVHLYYQIYSDVPVIRKWISIINKTGTTVIINNLVWESLNIEIASPSWIPQICTFPDVYANYGQSVRKPPYVGRTDDAALLIFDPINEEGIILGNEAPAIMKRTSVYPDSTNISIGMGFAGEEFPFKKFLGNNEEFISPKGFIMPYKGAVWQNAFDGYLSDFVRKYMGVKLFERKEVPLFFYNTWNPFMTNINEKLIKELADVTSKAGVEYLIMDDGWQDTYGDWNVDANKFPNGLKPVCDYIKSKGLKPGMWISIATVTDSSKIYKEHPEWIVRDRDGKQANLHASVPTNCLTMNLTTPYYDYIKEKIIGHVQTCNIEYLKLDLAAVYSSYKLNNYEVGDYASNRLHKDKDESIYMMYQKIYQLIDELKMKFPNLYVDCTFELYGEIYGIDYSLIQHADGDWLSNIGDSTSKGSLYMRQLCYDRARIVPASTMLIGNMQMNWGNSKLCYESLLSSSVIMLGDPRKISAEKLQWFKKRSLEIRRLENKYHFSRYYQTSNVFSRPENYGWDGCSRFNKEANGGLLCFYRNNSPESKRRFQLPWVNSESNYNIKSISQNKSIGIIKGADLKSKGLEVYIESENSSNIFSIEAVK